MSLKAKIEAVLFVTDKPIRAQAIARIVNADVQAVRQALIELIHDYEERNGGLEISDEDGYSFQIKDEYASLMDEFMPVELSAALIRTLSAIAIKQPISQSEIIRVRGAGAYEHIKELVNRELVAKREEQGGRSPILSTTKKFQEYFRLSKDGKDLRNYLKKQVRKAEAAAAENAGQLVIPSVVSNEADEQLNNRIYLETADMSDDKADVPVVGDFEPDAAVAELSDTGMAAADTAVLSAADNMAPDVSLPAESTAVVAQNVAVQAAAQAEVQPEKAELVVEETQAKAAETLSRLAAAATAREPEPVVLPEDAPEEAILAEDDQSTAGDAGTRKSTVQAATSKKKEPGMGNAPKRARRPATDKLSELLNKQKLFEKQLKLGFLELNEEPEIDCAPDQTAFGGNTLSDVDTTH